MTSLQRQVDQYQTRSRTRPSSQTGEGKSESAIVGAKPQRLVRDFCSVMGKHEYDIGRVFSREIEQGHTIYKRFKDFEENNLLDKIGERSRRCPRQYGQYGLRWK